MDKEQIEKYKENICPQCIHYNDTNFADCEICECVDGTIRCVEYKRKNDVIRQNRNNRNFKVKTVLMIK